MSDALRKNLPTYTISDGRNRLSHQVMPRIATLECAGMKPVPYHQLPDNDATRRAHEAVGMIAMRQLPMGGAAANTTAAPVRNSTGQMESPLATLCRAARSGVAR